MPGQHDVQPLEPLLKPLLCFFVLWLIFACFFSHSTLCMVLGSDVSKINMCEEPVLEVWLGILEAAQRRPAFKQLAWSNWQYSEQQYLSGNQMGGGRDENRKEHNAHILPISNSWRQVGAVTHTCKLPSSISCQQGGCHPANLLNPPKQLRQNN